MILKHKIIRWCWCLLGFVGLSLLPTTVFARKASNLAAALARLRGEVESLSSKIDEKKRSIRSQMRSIAMRKSSLELSLQRAQLQMQQLKRQRDKQRLKVTRSGQKEASLQPVILASIKDVVQVVKFSIPFRKKERLGVLNRLSQQLKRKLLQPRKAASRLWQFIEDEVRLTKENGIYRQIIQVDGKKQLVDIVRLGMVMLFFKTRSGQYGSAVFQKGAWKFQVIQNRQTKETISALFIAMKQQVRVGFWTLPNQLRKK